MQAERRIFRRQTLQRDAHFLLIAFGFRLNRQRNNRVRELHALKRNDGVRIGERVAGGYVFQPHAGRDIPGAQFIHLVAIVGLHQYDSPDALFLPFYRVIHRVAFTQHARVDADKGQLPDVRIAHQLERQRRERLIIARVTLRVLPFFIHAINGRHVQRRRHQLDHRIEHALHPFVFKRAAAEHRLDLARDSANTQPFNNFRFRQVAGFQVLVHQFIAGFRRRRDHFFPPFLGGTG